MNARDPSAVISIYSLINNSKKKFRFEAVGATST